MCISCLQDWNDFSPVGQLARRSFDLHEHLSKKLGADRIQYRRLKCATLRVGGNPQKPNGKKLEGVEWTPKPPMRLLGDQQTIAQVHPKQLCLGMWKEASKPKAEGGVGSTIVKGKVVGPVHDDKGNCMGVRLEDGTVVKGDAVLFACGPWTANVMTGVKYHSIVLKTTRVEDQCIFFSGCGDPEVYVRPDSTAYCTGFPDQATIVTEEPGEESVRPEAVQRIVDAVNTAIRGTDLVIEDHHHNENDDDENDNGNNNNGKETRGQACYLPMTPDGLPIMGLLGEDVVGGGGCYIATGHTCWGILLGPATGESMATLIATGDETPYVDLTPYSPSRYGDDLVILDDRGDDSST